MVVSDTFENRNVLITGGSGFLGKALIENLLRTYTNIGKLYILLRPKKNKTVEERLNIIVENPLFDILKEVNPDALKKLVPINGDVAQLKLGISEEDRRVLIENVNIIYHSSASVRFDDLLRDAVIVNVRAVREMIELAYQMKDLLVFVHVSTTYCNCDKSVIAEEIYPTYGNWREAIKIAEEGDLAVLQAVTEKYISPLPNTYTYAKSLAEMAVLEMCKGRIPTVIVRPSIVVSTLNEPFPGWNDNLNGPVGLLIAGGKGLLRIVLGRYESMQDYIPADIVLKIMILASHNKAITRNFDEVDVYNAASLEENRLTLRDLLRMGRRLIKDEPFSQILWYPRFSATVCSYNYILQVLLFHMLPAFFLDIGLRIAGHKPMLVKVQRKIYIGNYILAPFLLNTWTFKNENTLTLFKNLDPEDKVHFNLEAPFKFNEEEYYEFYKKGKVMAGTLLLNEVFNKEKNRKFLWRLWLLDVTVKAFAGLITFWLLFIKFNLVENVLEGITRYWRNLEF